PLPLSLPNIVSNSQKSRFAAKTLTEKALCKAIKVIHNMSTMLDGCTSGFLIVDKGSIQNEHYKSFEDDRNNIYLPYHTHYSSMGV
ncbi:unnamed protein product, partial [Sphenostylis stenocarpa]